MVVTSAKPFYRIDMSSADEDHRQETKPERTNAFDCVTAEFTASAVRTNHDLAFKQPKAINHGRETQVLIDF